MVDPPGDDDGGGVVVAVPMLRRAHRVAPLLESIVTTAPAARVVFAVTPSDLPVVDAVRAADAEMIMVAWSTLGDYARKINTVYRSTTEPLILLGADDLLFHPGWVAACRRALAPGIGVVGTNDLGSPRVTRGEHATHSLVTRQYADQSGVIDQPGAICHEGYYHEFVDDELVETAKARGAWAMALDAHVEHLHPNWDKAPNDSLYLAQRARMARGRPIYLRRRRLWT